MPAFCAAVVNDQRRYRQCAAVCRAHADRLRWAWNRLRARSPFTEQDLGALSDEDLAVIDQLFSRFSRLQDAMGNKLFPALLALTKEPVVDLPFIDKLHLLERIHAIDAADGWLELREIRNSLTHDYPEDPVLQCALLNRVIDLTERVLVELDRVDGFAGRYLTEEADDE